MIVLEGRLYWNKGKDVLMTTPSQVIEGGQVPSSVVTKFGTDIYGVLALESSMEHWRHHVPSSASSAASESHYLVRIG